MDPLPSTSVAQAPKSIQKQHTAVNSDELGKDIHEAIKDLPPSFGESGITWPEDLSGLEALIKRHLDGPLRALPNDLVDAARMRVTQNPPGGQNISQTPSQSTLVPSHTAGPGNVAINGDGLRAVPPSTQQPQIPPEVHQSSQPVSRVNAGASSDAQPWDLNMGYPAPQFHRYPVGYPVAPSNSAPSPYQLPPNGTPFGSFGSFEALQEMQTRQNGQSFQNLQASQAPQGTMEPRVNGQAPQSHQLQQARGPGPSNHAQHNGGLQQNIGYNQSTSLQIGGFQQNGNPQQNNRFQQNHRFQQSNSLQQNNGSQQSQASRQGEGFQSKIISDNVPNNSHEDKTPHQENLFLKKRRSTADPDGDVSAKKVPRKE